MKHRVPRLLLTMARFTLLFPSAVMLFAQSGDVSNSVLAEPALIQSPSLSAPAPAPWAKESGKSNPLAAAFGIAGSSFSQTAATIWTTGSVTFDGPLVSAGPVVTLGIKSGTTLTDDLNYFLAQQNATQTKGIQLQSELQALQEKFPGNPEGDLREKIRQLEIFIAKIRDVRSDAETLIDPILLPALEWLTIDAQERMDANKAGLNAYLLGANPESIAARLRIQILLSEIRMNHELADMLAIKIKFLQAQLNHEGTQSVLDSLARQSNDDVSTDSSINPNANKEKLPK